MVSTFGYRKLKIAANCRKLSKGWSITARLVGNFLKALFNRNSSGTNFGIAQPRDYRFTLRELL